MCIRDRYIFFASFIMLQACTMMPLELLNPAQLIEQGLRNLCCARTRRGVEEANAAQPMYTTQGIKLAGHLLVFVISLVYASMSPLMIPFSLTYFILGTWVSRHNFIHTYVPLYESGGGAWYSITRCLVLGLFIYVVTFTGVLLLKEANHIATPVSYTHLTLPTKA